MIDMQEFLNDYFPNQPISNVNTNELLVALTDYKNQEDDERTYEKLKILHKMHNWLSIIGIVYLVKIIVTLAIICIKGTAILELLKMLDKLM